MISRGYSPRKTDKTAQRKRIDAASAFFKKTVDTKEKVMYTIKADMPRHADMAQLVEQLIRNQQVVGSSPTISSRKNLAKSEVFSTKSVLTDG